MPPQYNSDVCNPGKRAGVHVKTAPCPIQLIPASTLTYGTHHPIFRGLKIWGKIEMLDCEPALPVRTYTVKHAIAQGRSYVVTIPRPPVEADCISVSQHATLDGRSVYTTRASMSAQCGVVYRYPTKLPRQKKSESLLYGGLR